MISGPVGDKNKKRAIALAVLFVLITASCGNFTSASNEIIGIWKATDIRYADTSFEIKRKAITFMTKEGDVNNFPIVKVKKEQMDDKDWVEYIIYYRDHDLKKVEFPFYFHSSGRSIIRFKNQPSLVWIKNVSTKT